MGIAAMSQPVRASSRTDEEVVAEVLKGQTSLFEVLVQRYNQRLFRVVRGIVADDGEAEDVMQDAYVHAYQHLAQFEGRASFSTWLIRIAVRNAMARRQRRGRFEAMTPRAVETREGITWIHWRPVRRIPNNVRPLAKQPPSSRKRLWPCPKSTEPC